MLIPSIDLQNGHVVQLVQGERLAIEAPDAEPWIQKFSTFARVQLIDLDAARGRGDNAAIVAAICRRLPCRVGGGIRSIERAREVLAAGAHAVITSSALFTAGAGGVGVFGRPAGAVGGARGLGPPFRRGGRRPGSRRGPSTSSLPDGWPTRSEPIASLPPLTAAAAASRFTAGRPSSRSPRWMPFARSSPFAASSSTRTSTPKA